MINFILRLTHHALLDLICLKTKIWRGIMEHIAMDTKDVQMVSDQPKTKKKKIYENYQRN